MIPCDDACNEAEYEIRNGDEVSNLCEASFRNALFDLVTGNDYVAFCTDTSPKAIFWRKLPLPRPKSVRRRS